ncbi:MAG: hypothetical protein IJ246_07485 [Clostridia bacterium]|nr:hypothetical protein [Clostridia bacterium]
MAERDWLFSMGMSEQEIASYENAVDRALQTLVAGITTEPDRDLTYLRDCREYYLETHLGRDLVPICDALMHLLTPSAEDEADRLNSDAPVRVSACCKVLVEAEKAGQGENILRAASQLMTALDEMEKQMSQDPENRFFDFQDSLGAFLYRDRKEPTYNLRRAPGAPFAAYRACLEAGKATGNAGLMQQALSGMERLDPVTAQTAFARAQMANDPAEGKKQVIRGIARAVTREELAQGYRMLRKNARESGQEDLASAAETWERRWLPGNAAVPDMPEKEAEKILCREGVPLGFDADVSRIARRVSQAFARMDCEELARSMAERARQAESE